MENVATLTKDGDQYAFRFPAAGLIVRGEYPEWVLEAAAEVLAHSEAAKSGSHLEEVEMLKEFEEASEVEYDIAHADHQQRFERIPQCVVTLKGGEFHWVSPAGRSEDEKTLQRIFDTSRTRNDTFLQDIPQNS